MTTLIFRFSSLGDVAITVPVIRCLSKKYPNHNFIVVSEKNLNHYLQKAQMYLFSVVILKEDIKVKGLINLYKDLSEFNPTRIADLHNVLRSKILSLFLNLVLKSSNLK